MLRFPLGIRLADMIFPLSLCHHLDFCFHITVQGHAGDTPSMLVLEQAAALQNLPTESKEAPKVLIFFPIPLHLPAPFPQPHTPKKPNHNRIYETEFPEEKSSKETWKQQEEINTSYYSLELLTSFL